MRISAKGFIYHKSAEKFVDCFDRYSFNTKNHKFAVADGVSKSFFPDVWAQLLVNFFVENDERIDLTDSVSYKKIQNAWIKKIAQIVNKPNQKYYVKNFFVEGRSAAATFVGLNFFKEDGILKWEAVALGDSYLFFIPENTQSISNNFDNVIHLSSKNSFEFNNFPDFFDSRSLNNKGKIKQKKQDVKNGSFYIMTDAMAEWFVEQKEHAISVISAWETQEDFENDIKKYRTLGMNNDDATILVINIIEDEVSEIQYDKINISDFQKLLENENSKVINDISIRETLPTIDEQIISKFDYVDVSEDKNNTINLEGDSLKKKEKKEKKEEKENKALVLGNNVSIEKANFGKNSNIWLRIFCKFFGITKIKKNQSSQNIDKKNNSITDKF